MSLTQEKHKRLKETNRGKKNKKKLKQKLKQIDFCLNQNFVVAADVTATTKG